MIVLRPSERKEEKSIDYEKLGRPISQSTLRAPLIYFLPGGLDSMKLLTTAIAAAGFIQNVAGTPEQVHIALAGQDASGDATGFAFSWYTEDNTTVSTVEYTIGSSATPVTATGTSTQYLPGHGFHHTVRATGIPTDTQISYRVGSQVEGTWSQYFNATTPPPKTTARTVKFSVFGDMGYGDSSMRPMAIATGGLVKNWSASFSRQTMETLKDTGGIEAVWHLGDIGYADDAFGHDPVKFLFEDAYNGYGWWSGCCSLIRLDCVCQGTSAVCIHIVRQ